MDTYYLWYRGDDGVISVGSRISRGDDSKFLVEIETGGLNDGLAALKKTGRPIRQKALSRSALPRRPGGASSRVS